MILWSAREKCGAQPTWHLRDISVEVANPTPDQVLDNGIPARFKLTDGKLVSDH